VLAQGVVHQAQPAEAIAAAAVSIPHEPWKLGAVAAVTTITGSALIALALAAGHIDADAAWRAAQVDEDWNLSTWGRDEEAVTRHAAKRRDLEAAALVLRQSA
jgi:chaperone required for assembly of F1-ATPase